MPKTPLKVILDKIGNEAFDPVQLGDNCSIPNGTISTIQGNHVGDKTRQRTEVLKYLLDNHSPKEVDSILAEAFEAMGKKNLARRFRGQTQQNGSARRRIQDTDPDPSSPKVMIPGLVPASRGRGVIVADSDDPDPAKSCNWWKYSTIILLFVCLILAFVQVQKYIPI